MQASPGGISVSELSVPGRKQICRWLSTEWFGNVCKHPPQLRGVFGVLVRAKDAE